MGQISRENVPIEETWDLTDIFSSDKEWKHSLSELDERVTEMNSRPLSIRNSKDLLKSLLEFNQLLADLNRTTSYAFNKFSEEESNSNNQNMLGISNNLDNKANDVKINFVNTILSIPKHVIDKYIEEEKHLKPFQRFLERINEIRDHSLSEELENALIILDDTLTAAEFIYKIINSSDLAFESVKDKNGKIVPISLHTYMAQIETSPDTELRRNAFNSLKNGLVKHQHGIAKTLATEINKHVALAKLRGYPSAIDMLLQHSTPSKDYYSIDGVKAEFFEEILDTFQQGLSSHFQRYAKLRKKQLGLDKLLFSDVKAPLDPEYDPSITFEEAGKISVEAVSVLGEEYREEMRQAYNNRWIYHANNKGCRMIPFGRGTYNVHGYSFYPWGGNLFDMLLLGHELGHAIHYSLSGKHQPAVNFSQSQYFAEAPSTMVEQLIVNYLKETRKDDVRLQRWLNMYLMMSYHHNCVTHILEAELLRRLYKAAEKNIPLTTTFISETKGAILSEFWGDTVEIDEGAKLTWMRQNHYYMGLYPFTYSVGITASTIIAQRIKTEGVYLGEQWTNVLKQGGNKNGFDLFQMVGLDMTTMENFKKIVDHIGKIVDELEKSF
ncbi:M3 family metallopeptidase [Bacillus sp. JJ1532]|uniref:M3 family metallopeptidase n=1 Tax=Bacillus sp. JJ1532 TaxID=3122958 RepID=UPI0030006067